MEKEECLANFFWPHLLFERLAEGVDLHGMFLLLMQLFDGTGSIGKGTVGAFVSSVEFLGDLETGQLSGPTPFRHRWDHILHRDQPGQWRARFRACS